MTMPQAPKPAGTPGVTWGPSRALNPLGTPEPSRTPGELEGIWKDFQEGFGEIFEEISG